MRAVPGTFLGEECKWLQCGYVRWVRDCAVYIKYRFTSENVSVKGLWSYLKIDIQKTKNKVAWTLLKG